MYFVENVTEPRSVSFLVAMDKEPFSKSSLINSGVVASNVFNGPPVTVEEVVVRNVTEHTFASFPVAMDEEKSSKPSIFPKCQLISMIQFRSYLDFLKCR